MTEPELIEYVNEHLIYELLMLRYAKRQLDSCQDQLLWNAMFAAFNVSARNLYDLLSGGGDTRSVRLKDFEGHAGTWCASSTAAISPTVDKLNRQCLHLGKDRTKVSDKKVALERIRHVFEWAESNVLSFMGNLDFKEAIDLGRADLEKKLKTSTLMLKLSGAASATNISDVVTTSSVSATFFSVPKDEPK